MVPITPEEARLPYAKYYDQPMAQIPTQKLAIWHGPMADPALATPFAQRNRFLDPEPMPLEAGFTIAPDGTGFVSNATFMPGVTPEMFYWWFAWHCVGSDLRYKLWDRDDHYFARAMDPDYVLDPKVPLAEKTWGVTHDISEDVGLGVESLQLAFCKPSRLGYDMTKLGTPGCAALVCGSATAVMTHKVMQAPGGVWLKSHFWMGIGFRPDGTLGRLIPEDAQVPEAVVRALFGHNIKEFTNLAAILPAIYSEQRDTWL